MNNNKDTKLWAVLKVTPMNDELIKSMKFTCYANGLKKDIIAQVEDYDLFRIVKNYYKDYKLKYQQFKAGFIKEKPKCVRVLLDTRTNTISKTEYKREYTKLIVVDSVVYVQDEDGIEHKVEPGTPFAKSVMYSLIQKNISKIEILNHLLGNKINLSNIEIDLPRSQI